MKAKPAHAKSREGKRLKALLQLKDRALAAVAEGIAIADARLPDTPLIYVNAGFERLTGYSADEVLGRNCRFLQGPGSDRDTLDQLRAALRAQREVAVQLLNYRKDGTTFWNRLSITPVRDRSGAVTHFIAVQSDVTAEKNAQDALQRANEQLEAANRRLRQDLEAAAAVQRSLLPTVLPEIPGLRFAWRFLPCQEPERPDKYVVAAPSEVAARLNQHFRSSRSARQYFTMVYGVLDAQTRELRYVTAGHRGPVLVRRGAAPIELAAGGLPIGLLPAESYEERAVRLEPGDRLYLATDGLTEAENTAGQEFGVAKLLEAHDRNRRRPLDESLREVTACVQDWCAPAPLADDVAMLAVECDC